MKKLILSMVLVSTLSIFSTALAKDKKLYLTTVEQEIKMGEASYKDIISKSKLANESPTYAILQRVGSRIAAVTGEKNYKWEYNLIEDKRQDAWCMPGGKIGITTGAMSSIKNEAELAALLGHQIAHVTLRHIGQRISQAVATQMMLKTAAQTMGKSDNSEQILAAMGASANVGVTLPYEREQDIEADKAGLQLMAKAGYDPQEALNLFERYSAIADKQQPEFLSIHPTGPERTKNLVKNLKNALKAYETSQKYGTGVTL